MVSVDHHHLGKAVGVDGVVGKADLVPLASGVNNVVCEGRGGRGVIFLRACFNEPWLRLKRKLHMYLSYTFPLRSASSWDMICGRNSQHVCV